LERGEGRREKQVVVARGGKAIEFPFWNQETVCGFEGRGFGPV